jgi:acyl-CoA hydrolase
MRAEGEELVVVTASVARVHDTSLTVGVRTGEESKPRRRRNRSPSSDTSPAPCDSSTASVAFKASSRACCFCGLSSER